MTKTFALALVAAMAVAAPAFAQVKMGDQNSVNQNGKVNGAQIATANGPASTAVNGNASIIGTNGGVAMGNKNSINQTGTINGAQIATAIGPAATAVNGNASIIGTR